jgi:hypothetical protein
VHSLTCTWPASCGFWLSPLHEQLPPPSRQDTPTHPAPHTWLRHRRSCAVPVCGGGFFTRVRAGRCGLDGVQRRCSISVSPRLTPPSHSSLQEQGEQAGAAQHGSVWRDSAACDRFAVEAGMRSRCRCCRTEGTSPYLAWPDVGLWLLEYSVTGNTLRLTATHMVTPAATTCTR